MILILQKHSILSHLKVLEINMFLRHTLKITILVIFIRLASPIFAAISDGNDYIGLDPKYLKMKVYKLALSEDPYCQNPIIIFENDSPTYLNMIDLPNLGNGEITEGNYHCRMIEVSDKIVFASNSSAGGCTLEQEENTDICSDSNISFQLIEDQSIQTCNNNEQKIAIFFSTASANESNTFTNNGFMAPKPSNLNLGYRQNDELFVNSPLLLQLVVNGHSRIDNRNNTCEMQLPLFKLTQK